VTRVVVKSAGNKMEERISIVKPTRCTISQIYFILKQHSWWGTERPSETCRVLFQNNLRYCASGWVYYRNILRCTVLKTSNRRKESLLYKTWCEKNTREIVVCKERPLPQYTCFYVMWNYLMMAVIVSWNM